MKGLALPAITLLSAVVMTACQAKNANWSGTMSRDGNTVIVANPSEPVHATPVMSLKEEQILLRLPDANVSGIDGTGDFVLEPSGSAFLFDRASRTVYFYDEKTNQSKKIEGFGGGRLDSRALCSMNPLPASRLLFIDAETGDALTFSRRGYVLDKQILPGWGRLFDSRTDEFGNLYFAAVEYGGAAAKGTVRMALRRWSWTRGRAETIFSLPLGTGLNDLRPLVPWTIGPDNGLYLVDTANQSILILNENSQILRKIRFEKAIDRSNSKPRAVGRMISIDTGGRIFLEVEKSAPAGGYAFLVFDAEGRWQGRANFPCRPRWWTKTHLYGVEWEDGHRSYKKYGLSWNFRF